MTAEDRGEQLQEGADDYVGETETAEEAVMLVLEEVGAVLDGREDDDVKDCAKDAEAEVDTDEDSPGCDVVHCDLSEDWRTVLSYDRNYCLIHTVSQLYNDNNYKKIIQLLGFGVMRNITRQLPLYKHSGQVSQGCK